MPFGSSCEGQGLGTCKVSQAQQQEISDQPAAIPLGEVHLCDVNPGMLQEGVKKAAASGLGTKTATLSAA